MAFALENVRCRSDQRSGKSNFDSIIPSTGISTGIDLLLVALSGQSRLPDQQTNRVKHEHHLCSMFCTDTDIARLCYWRLNFISDASALLALSQKHVINA